MITLSKIKPLAINLNSGILLNNLPPNAVKKSDGNVLTPKKIIPKASKNGF